MANEKEMSNTKLMVSKLMPNLLDKYKAGMMARNAIAPSANESHTFVDLRTHPPCTILNDRFGSKADTRMTADRAAPTYQALLAA